MATDLRLLGKLLALTRSDEPAESALAASRFTSALSRWCAENGLPPEAGYITLCEPDRAACRLADVLASACDARVLLLEPFEIIAVGSEADCRWLAWWFARTYSEIERTARRANYRERYLFMDGAIAGVERVLADYRPSQQQAVQKKMERPPVRLLPEDRAVTEAMTPAPTMSAPQRATVNDGMSFGARLGHTLLAQRPPKR